MSAPSASDTTAPTGLPLSGRRILLTRPREQGQALRRLLEQRGAQVLELPLIELAPVADPAPLDAAIRRLGTFAWVVFTSANAVRFFWLRLEAAGLSLQALGPAAVAALGPATAAALSERGVRADLVPSRATQADLLAELLTRDLCGKAVLVPASELASQGMDAALEAAGAQVTRVVAYTNRVPQPDPDALAALDAPGGVDAVVFASPSAVTNLVPCVGPERARRLLAHAAAACIGPATAAALTACRGSVAIQAESGDVAALAGALCDHFAALPRACT